MANTKPMVDTNIMVYAHNLDSPFHDSARHLLTRLIQEGGFSATSLILFEFFAVITDGRKIEAPLSPEAAWSVVKDCIESERIDVLESTCDAFFWDWMKPYTGLTKRYQIYDASIAYAMDANSISIIFTKNTRDFKKFDFIEAIDPFRDGAVRKKQTEKPFIPYGRQSIDEQDVAAVCSVLRSDWLTTGPKVGEFERAVADYVGAEHGVAVSSGTAALHCAMYAVGIGPGDEVIVPPMTFAATANCVVYQGGTPVFADVEADTLLIDPAEVEKKITERTRAVIAVDYAGQPCDYDALRGIADRHGIALVADGCHALGAEYRGRKVGTLVDMTVFSFHPVKHIATGEGGMVVTDRGEYAEKVRLFRNHGITTDHRQREARGSWFYEMVDLGFNYRMTDIQCALGMSQLAKLPGFLARRRAIADRYDAAFRDSDAISPLGCRKNVLHAYHLYVVRVRDDREQWFEMLREKGIGVNVHYIPVYLHPFYRKSFDTGCGRCPVASAQYEQIISLPVFPGLSESIQDDIIEMMLTFGGGRSSIYPPPKS